MTRDKLERRWQQLTCTVPPHVAAAAFASIGIDLTPYQATSADLMRPVYLKLSSTQRFLLAERIAATMEARARDQTTTRSMAGLGAADTTPENARERRIVEATLRWLRSVRYGPVNSELRIKVVKADQQPLGTVELEFRVQELRTTLEFEASSNDDDEEAG